MIDRLMEAFANEYHVKNPGLYSHAGTYIYFLISPLTLFSEIHKIFDRK
jgi:hypothetical protein